MARIFNAVDCIQLRRDRGIAMALEVFREGSLIEFAARKAKPFRDAICRFEQVIRDRYCCLHVFSITAVIPPVNPPG